MDTHHTWIHITHGYTSHMDTHNTWIFNLEKILLIKLNYKSRFRCIDMNADSASWSRNFDIHIYWLKRIMFV